MGKIRPREKLEDRPKDKRQRTDKEISPFLREKRKKRVEKAKYKEITVGELVIPCNTKSPVKEG